MGPNTDEERASYRAYLDLYSEEHSDAAEAEWREWYDKVLRDRERERFAKERLDEAQAKRDELLRRFGGTLDAGFVYAGESIGMVEDHLRSLFAVADALERRVAELEGKASAKEGAKT